MDRAFRRLAGACLITALLVPQPAGAQGQAQRAPSGRRGSPHPLAEPAVSMPAGMLVTIDGRELWSRAPTETRAMASTTKIMTAIVALEHAELSDLVTIERDATLVGESESGLRTGERVTVGQLLEAMLVKSGNDAAIALAEHVGSSPAGFVRLMDAEAVRLGLAQTDFANPHGLDAEGHHASARDLATLTRFALSSFPEFRRIVALSEVTLNLPRGPVTLETSNKLIDTYEGCEGVKTGWTDDAGYCVVAAARRDGVELVAVVLGAESEDDRFKQAKTLLDWGFEHYRMREVAVSGVTAARVPVSDWLDVEVAAVPEQTAFVPVFDGDGPLRQVVSVAHSVRAPVTHGQRLGILTVTQGGRLVARVPLISEEGVRAPTWRERIRIRLTRIWRAVSRRG